MLLSLRKNACNSVNIVCTFELGLRVMVCAVGVITNLLGESTLKPVVGATRSENGTTPILMKRE